LASLTKAPFWSCTTTIRLAVFGDCATIEVALRLKKAAVINASKVNKVFDSS